MTQVISCITRDHAIQVSDRRLINAKTGELVDDDRNKAVHLERHLAFAYTGYATLPARRTDRWLLETIHQAVDGRADEILRHIAQRAQRAVERIPLPPTERVHAFIGAGFLALHTASNRSDEVGATELSPVIACVSNYHLSDGRRMSSAQPHFAITLTPLRDDQVFYLDVAGQPLSRPMRALDNEIASTGGDPNKIAAALAGEIWRSTKHNRAVGRRLMISAISREAASTPGPLISVPMSAVDASGNLDLGDLKNPTCVYISDVATCVGYAPYAVARSQMLRDFEYGIVTEPDESTESL